jgi:DNA helicase-2/ATP-dependent DNA helicase PcrA
MKSQLMQLNNQQQKAAEYDGDHVLVLAGAGTGKTRTIIARAAYLIQNSVDPKRILLLTFTRRAAKEMTTRLKQIIGQAGQGISAGTFL